MKGLTTQFSVSKKRDISARSEIGIFTAAKLSEFNGANFKDFATTEETSAAMECLFEQNSKKLKFDKKTEDSTFAQLVNHRYTHTSGLITSDSVVDEQCGAVSASSSSLVVFMKEPSAIEGGSSPKVCVVSRSARRVSLTI